MAETTTISRPAPYLEAAGQSYLDLLTKKVGQAPTAAELQAMSPQIAGQNQFAQAAQQQAARQAGLGALTFDPTTGAVTNIGAGTGIAGYEPFLQQAQQYTGPQAYQQFMSPYQQDVINTTLRQYDIQAQKGLPGLAAQAIAQGAYGGGREGVQRAEYQTQSDLNRALLEAQLRQQGFGQAQGLATNQFNQQMQLAGQQQGLLGSQISGLTALGAQQQAQQQAQLEAQKQLEYQKIYQPLQTAQQYGQGITGLIAGYPQQTQQQIAPSPSALQTGLGAASTLAGIYKTLFPSPLNVNYTRN